MHTFEEARDLCAMDERCFKISTGHCLRLDTNDFILCKNGVSKTATCRNCCTFEKPGNR